MADLSRADLYQTGRQYVVAHAVKIAPEMVDTEGSDVNVIVGSSSYMAAQVAAQSVDQTAALFLDSCADEQLDRWAADRYNLFRKAAAAAVGSVTFTRLTAAAGAGSIDIGSKLRTLTGVEYVTTSAAIFGASDLTATATVRAVQAGKDFQVGRNQIRRFASTPFDPTITVNNAVQTAGGENREEDQDFKVRIINFWLAARRGVLGAIVFGALTVPGVASAQAFEELEADAYPARVVTLYISDSSGISNTALAALVQVALAEYRAAGIKVVIVSSTPQLVDVQLHLTFRAGVDTSTLSENIRAAVLEFINSLPVNGPLYRSELGAVLSRFKRDGLIVDNGAIVSPTGDLVPDVGFTLRAVLAGITVV